MEEEVVPAAEAMAILPEVNAKQGPTRDFKNVRCSWLMELTQRSGFLTWKDHSIRMNMKKRWKLRGHHEINDPSETYKDETYPGVNGKQRELLEIELSTLPSLIKVVAENSVTDHLCVTELILHDQQFFQKLMDLFSV
ncbi:unnamed protein product [Lactuca saligna]|uniref:Uncharacterized protein n=1 Tax=Lactuca saligna TaxID=75948 RepID=A0AA35Z2R6_LACSI|nr:unnamed protein product [Lactuca saligna]